MKLQLEPSPTDRLLVDAFGSSVYAVGGRVRDSVLNQVHGTSYALKDYDYLIVGMEFEAVRERLQRLGRLDEVGATFAVLKATIGGTTIDVALPRREISTGSGHRDFDVNFGPEVSIEDDMARRDFTINALSVRLCDGELVGPANARADLESRTLRVLSDTSFRDDPLRIWRGVQFAARFNLAIESETWRQMLRDAPLASTVAPERINEELCKLLSKSQTPSYGLEAARRCGVLAQAIPELLDGFGCEQNRFHSYDVWNHTLAAVDAAPAQLLPRLATLMHDIGKPISRSESPGPNGYTFLGHEVYGAEITQTVLRRLRFSGETTDRVARLVENHMYKADVNLSDSAVRRMIRRIGEDNVDLQMTLRLADVRGRDPEDCLDQIETSLANNTVFAQRVTAILAEEPALSVKDLAVNGRDVVDHLISSGIKPAGYCGDRTVGSVLDALLEEVTEKPELNEKTLLQDRLRAHAATLRAPASGFRL